MRFATEQAIANNKEIPNRPIKMELAAFVPARISLNIENKSNIKHKKLKHCKITNKTTEKPASLNLLTLMAK